MKTDQYLAALKSLGLTPASKATAAALGVSVRQIMRYNAGHRIPRYVEIILQLYAVLSKRQRACILKDEIERLDDLLRRFRDHITACGTDNGDAIWREVDDALGDR